MAQGGDKAIVYDPPGAIGLVDPSAVLLLRFNEELSATRPQDIGLVCEDFDVAIGSVVMPAVTPAVLGRGRAFNGATTGLAARDLVPGATLLTRDCSIQVVLSWDVATQNAHAPGCIIARGLGATSAERICYGLQLDVVDVPSSTALVRWLWQDVAGTLHLQTGVQVVLPPGQFTMLTATRRWVSPTQVELAYYAGDLLLGTVTSANGSIGGGTTGAVQLGYRTTTGTPGNFLAGVVDELAVFDRELCVEEVEATWLRITVYQPRGVQLFREMFDDDFPLSTEPDSDGQLDIRKTGQALGFAAAAIEDLRVNFLPQRAYGQNLANWEQAAQVTPAPTASQAIAERRARVVSRMSQRAGISIEGIDQALAALLGGAQPSDLQFLAFSNQVVDNFATLDRIRWCCTPDSAISVVSGAASFQPGAGTYLFDDTHRDWVTMRIPSGGDGKGAHHLIKLAFTTPVSGAEAGIYFGNVCTGDYLILGLRDQAGSFHVKSESFVGGVSQGVVDQATIGANPAAIWLHLWQTDTPGTWLAAWSTTSATAGFSTSTPITHPTVAHWTGCYLRSTAALGSAPRADFDDSMSFAPFSNRPFGAYVLLDRTLGFSPDTAAANSVLMALRHAFTDVTFITTPRMLVDDPDCGLGFVPLGGY